jgi:hypothetical protein
MKSKRSLNIGILIPGLVAPSRISYGTSSLRKVMLLVFAPRKNAGTIVYGKMIACRG